MAAAAHTVTRQQLLGKRPHYTERALCPAPPVRSASSTYRSAMPRDTEETREWWMSWPNSTAAQQAGTGRAAVGEQVGCAGGFSSTAGHCASDQYLLYAFRQNQCSHNKPSAVLFSFLPSSPSSIPTIPSHRTRGGQLLVGVLWEEAVLVKQVVHHAGKHLLLPPQRAVLEALEHLRRRRPVRQCEG